MINGVKSYFFLYFRHFALSVFQLLYYKLIFVSFIENLSSLNDTRSLRVYVFIGISKHTEYAESCIVSLFQSSGLT